MGRWSCVYKGLRRAQNPGTAGEQGVCGEAADGRGWRRGDWGWNSRGEKSVAARCGCGQCWGARPLDSGLPGLGVATSGQRRLRALEEPPSTHPRFPGFQLQLLQAKEPLWSEGPPEPRPGGSLPPWHTHLHSARPRPPEGAAPRQWGAVWAGSELDKTWPPLVPTTVPILPALPEP